MLDGRFAVVATEHGATTHITALLQVLIQVMSLSQMAKIAKAHLSKRLCRCLQSPKTGEDQFAQFRPMEAVQYIVVKTVCCVW